MATNQRIWYAGESVSFAQNGSTTYLLAHGVQSAGMNVKFNLEEIFELGQSALYQLKERNPDVDVSVEKVLDGSPLLWHLATAGSVVGTLSGRLNQQCQIGMSLYSDLQDSASGTPVTQVTNSGMFTNSLSYEFNVNGAFKESLQLLGNNRIFGAGQYTSTTMNNTDSPQAISGSGGVNTRENFVVGEGTGNISIFPTDIEGVTSSGTIQVVQTIPSVYLQSVRVSINLNRQPIFGLGKRGIIYRFATVPIKVESSFEVTSRQGDGKTAYEEQDNLTNQTIKIVCQEGTTIYLGNQNKLSSVNFTPGSAGGGGANLGKSVYNYESFSTATISHPADPSGL